jgi:hypothetical protein
MTVHNNNQVLRRFACRVHLHRWGTGVTRPNGLVERTCNACGKHVIGRGSRYRPNTTKAVREGRRKAQGDTAQY